MKPGPMKPPNLRSTAAKRRRGFDPDLEAQGRRRAHLEELGHGGFSEVSCLGGSGLVDAGGTSATSWSISFFSRSASFGSSFCECRCRLALAISPRSAQVVSSAERARGLWFQSGWSRSSSVRDGQFMMYLRRNGLLSRKGMSSRGGCCGHVAQAVKSESQPP